jgi:hypothetical protein
MQFELSGQTIRSDGRQFRVEVDHQDKCFTSLTDLAHKLIQMGWIERHQAQSGLAVSHLAGQLAESLEQVIGSTDNAIKRKVVITFAGGRFAARPYSTTDYRGWQLCNPTEGEDVARIRGEKGHVVGYVTKLVDILKLASDRSFKAINGTIPYDQVNATYLEHAQQLFSDLTVTFGDTGESFSVGPSTEPLTAYRQQDIPPDLHIERNANELITPLPMPPPSKRYAWMDKSMRKLTRYDFREARMNNLHREIEAKAASAQAQSTPSETAVGEGQPVATANPQPGQPANEPINGPVVPPLAIQIDSEGCEKSEGVESQKQGSTGTTAKARKRVSRHKKTKPKDK